MKPVASHANDPSSTGVDRRRRGQLGEQAAVDLLQRYGYEIIARNVRLGRVELDVICRDGAELVFVEVKARWSADFGTPADAVTRAKRTNLVLAATRYLEQHGLDATPWRIDVLSVTLRADRVVSHELLRHAVEDES